MPGNRHVALLIESSRAYGRGLLRGVARYIRTHRHWTVSVQVRGTEDPPPPWLKSWKGDGFLVRLQDRAMEKAILKSGLPALDLRGDLHSPIPLFRSNDELAARMAFQHLVERGFRALGYCGYGGATYSERRLQFFQRFCDEAGIPCSIYQSPRPAGDTGLSLREQQAHLFEQELFHWLQTLPRPIGVMASNDMRGQQVLNGCRELAIGVPEEIAVIGVDNDELLCELSNPPLSSVDPDTEHIGYQAAELLDRMMDGAARPPAETLLEPRGVVARQSTEVLAIEDADVAAAVRFIRKHACEGIDVGDVVAQLPVSRRSLERRFRKYLERSPNEEIARVQIQRVRELLSETDLPLGAIAQLAGFRHAEYMSLVFRKHEGQLPRDYRKRHESRK